MATRAQKVRLAIFLVFATSVLGGFLLIVAGAQLLRQRITYYIQFEESVGGLTAGDPVKYQGITVGRVEDTRVSENEIGNIIVEIYGRRVGDESDQLFARAEASICSTLPSA